MRNKQSKINTFILVVGDAVVLYVSLYLTLAVRNLFQPEQLFFQSHLYPFTIAFAFWIIIFGVSGLYDIRTTKNGITFIERLGKAVVINAIFAMFVFYVRPEFKLTPKTNLALDVFISSLGIFGWRYLYNILIASRVANHVLFFGVSKEIIDAVQLVEENPQFGYITAAVMLANHEPILEQFTYPIFESSEKLETVISNFHIDTIVIAPQIKENKNLVRMFFEVLPLGISVIEFPNFYEGMTGKIPVSLIQEVWFLENLVDLKKSLYDRMKRASDILFAALLGIPALAVMPLIALGIALDNPGPIFFRQKRIGKNGSMVELVKFRTMIPEAAAMDAQWSKENDSRITRFGKLLRKTRLDELPQLWNIIKGDISFVGPRPEQVDITKMLKEKIPFYDMRHLVQPGLTGWAQINPPYYYSSVDDTYVKLQYDLYYIKNRSFALDLNILFRTAMIVASQEGR
ncbi:sugar transferase [Patescibacteria group bacterium]|nr:sugar transferase [Patescibacteria group bacterium]